MKVVNKKMSVILILMLVIIESCTIFLMYKSYSSKETKLDEVNLQEINSNMFAIMLEQDDGTYKEDTSNTWPTSGYKFNADMSGCIDINGNKIDGVLSYDATNNIATVDTSSTSYCYLYFSKPPNLNTLCQDYNDINECEQNENLEDVEGIWDSTLESDGYRYVGTNPNNYMCFGTTDKSTCTGNTDAYMYRIIGIFEDADGNEHLKLIKKEALNTSYKWHSSYTTDVDWDGSDLYTGINGSYFLTNTTYSYMQDTIWTDKITSWNYTATNTLTFENYIANSVYGIVYSNNTPKSIYLHELNRSTKADQTCYYSTSATADCSVGEWKEVAAKIGLMYASDYSLSLGTTTLDSLMNSNYSTMKTGWMHISNNASAPPSSYEWTMSRYGGIYGDYHAWNVNSIGDVNGFYLTDTSSVRPVFYLESDAKITGGTGSSSNPYIIS